MVTGRKKQNRRGNNSNAKSERPIMETRKNPKNLLVGSKAFNRCDQNRYGGRNMPFKESSKICVSKKVGRVKKDNVATWRALLVIIVEN